MRLWLTLVITALAAGVNAAYVGELSQFSEIDPQPEFNIISGSRAVISPDGRFAIIASPGEVATFDSAVISARIDRGEAQIISRLTHGTDRTSQPVLSPDGLRLAVTGSTGRVHFFEVNPLTGALTETGDVFPGGLISSDHRPVFNAEGNVLYYGNSNAPGQLFVLDADPTGGIDTSPLDSITLGSSLEAFRMAVSGDGSTLVVAALKRSGLNDDSLIVYDIEPGTGLLTERGRFEPLVDLGWTEFHNPVVSFDGLNAYVVDVLNLQILQVDISGASPSVIAQAPTLPNPQSLTLGEWDNVLLNVCANGVAIFDIDDGDPVARGSFQPPGASFSPENNAILNFEGTLGAVVNHTTDTVYTFKTFPRGVNLEALDTFSTLQNPTSIAGGFDMRRILVLNTNPDAVDETATVLETQEPGGNPVMITAMSEDLSYSNVNTPVIDPNGVMVYATSNGPLVNFPVFSPDEQQFGSQLIRNPFMGLDMVISEDGSTLAANDFQTVHIYTDPLAQNPSGTFSAVNATLTDTRMAITADGGRVFVPDNFNDRVYVVDTSTTGTFDETSGGVQSFTLPLNANPSIAALSPDESQLSINLFGAGQVITYSVDAGTGTLSNPRTQDIPFTLHRQSNPIFLGIDRGVIAAGGNLYLYDTTQSATTPLDSFAAGTAFGTLAPVPFQDRFVALDAGAGEALVVELGDADLLQITGIFGGVNVGVSSRARVTPDGIAVIPNGVLPGGGLMTFDTERFGFNDIPFGSAVTGFTSQVAVDRDGTFAASLDETNGLAYVHHLSRGANPRLTRAVLLENSDTINGVGDPGEQLLLTFDRPVFPTEFINIQESYFNITGGGSIGFFSFLFPDITTGFNQANLILGTGTSGIVATGDTVGIDIAAAAPVGLFESISDSAPAIDLGLTGEDDAGVDITLPMGSVTDTFTPGVGLVLQLPQGADFLFDRHSLNIPPNALGQAASFSLLPASFGNFPGIVNAVVISTDAPDPNNLFNPPATLTLEYDPASFNISEAQFEYFGVKIVQIFDLGEGPEIFVLPGPFTIDTEANTISMPLSGLDPLGLGSRVKGTDGAASGVGTFATIPVNPVDERSIYLGASGRNDVAPAQVAMLTSGDNGAYSQHTIEFPGYVETTDTDPNRIQVTIRTANLFERVSMTGGDSFPTQSGALFVVQTQDANAVPVEFADPVNLSVQFIERENDRETDTVDFTSLRGHASQMRIVRDAVDGASVDFDYVGGTAAGSVVTLSGYTTLTGISGSGTLGAVIDPFAPIDEVGVDDIINHLLGSTPLSPGDQTSIDHGGPGDAPDGVIDAADLVYFINNP